MIKGLFETGSLPVLERLVQFTGGRHKLIAHNIANLSTPNFRPTDVSAQSFQEAMGRAVDRRRQGAGIFMEGLSPKDSRRLRFEADRLEMRAEQAHQNLLFHDKNDRSMEHQMQTLAENAMTHNMALEMMKNHFDLLRSAIREQA